MVKKIEKPDISSVSYERTIELLARADIQQIVARSQSPYVYWTKVKHWSLPEGVTSEELWAVIKVLRSVIFKSQRRVAPVRDEGGREFQWIAMTHIYEERLHQMTLSLGGHLWTDDRSMDEKFRQRMLRRGLLEEAIASSQLEGAQTTRKVAKQMIREGRKPRSAGEHMIVNNYEAMRLVEQELIHEPLSVASILQLHATLTKNTNLNVDAVGRFRLEKNDGEFHVLERSTGEVLHQPPSAVFVQQEMERLIAYANDELREGGFVHPVVKAMILHFWMAYLHPFEDGNGRMARIVFYWYVLRHQYWMFTYLPLSRLIKAAPAQYRDAYLFAEQDDYDLTYFLDYHLRMIQRAMDEFASYQDAEWSENARISRIARERYGLNDRQVQVLRYLYKYEHETTSITTHMRIQDVSRITARNDLIRLVDMGLLTSKKVGRTVLYSKTAQVDELFA